MTIVRFSARLTVAALLGCGCRGDSESSTKRTLREEGEPPGEWTDGADNDADGWFDCDDNGCWSAPDCDGPPSGDADTGTDTDVTYTLGFDCDETLVDVLESYGLFDCTVTFAGAGMLDVTDARLSTFEGTWEVTEHDCGASGLEEAV
ncbi:MAG: hypothetical protein CL927_16740 [Deltaproteobacteria bacterium]|nr:hypothetical protein [Deltaproteobacteria bacterium]HCH62883.1 hypothetical protein [Deltaproteobacteria bacterium]